MRKKSLLLVACLAAVCTTARAQEIKKEPKVLFIGLDGTRSDALQAANTPTIDSLIANGISTYDSWHLGVTVSGPSWSNMLTGVWEAKHKVTNNNYNGADYANWPYIPNRVKELRPDVKAVQIITWNSMDDASKGTGGNVYNAEWNSSIDVGNQGEDLIMEASKIQLQDPELDFLFAYIQDADGAGHGTGFSLTSAAYINAIEHNDEQIREIIKTLKKRPTYDKEEWLIVCSTDHGGLGFGHGGNSDQERHIWWFASADFLKTRQLTGSDPGSYQMPGNPVDVSKLKNVPLQVDVAVTVIDHLLPDMDGEEVRDRWNLDGKSWLTPDNYDSTLYHNQKGGIPGIGLHEMKSGAEVRVYPNPAGDVVKLHISSAAVSYADYSYEITDMQGRAIRRGKLEATVESNIDIRQLKEGIYFLKISDGTQVSTQKLVVKR